ncbi:hypothetical protein BDP27DRAFT_1263254 [Rhodocollybia butyracea]|uniref:Mtf2-like C-terminal domain-containing protein n=1 Tax=Rhodocollybia butyracea TaxID=206335 RepID=A0A9P5PRG4_9AGAR|nr:hypothetical protein BDP27DRAFT_1263254 [Rhodocollybia butyracea]
MNKFSRNICKIRRQSTLRTAICDPCSSSGPCRRIQSYSTDTSGNAKKPKSDKTTSIFNQEGDAWDHVFKDIQNMPPLTPFALKNPIRTVPRQSRKQEMTASELNAFDDMFNMIFNAVSEQKITDKGPMNARLGGGLGDIFGKLRKHSKRMRWTTEAEELLDRKKEAMDLCETDQELLEWTIREVFDESKKLEAASREALQNINNDPKTSTESLPVLQSPIYPHLLALLMRSFRDKYQDPHLALAIFDHARNLSIPSYVFGCTTLAYNELIQTKWTHFRDLKGVHDALQEMVVNGVGIDNNTRKIVDVLRREAGERNLGVEDEYVGEGELWNALESIESLVKQPESQSDKPKWDQWKSSDQDDKDWGFDNWEPSTNSAFNR